MDLFGGRLICCRRARLLVQVFVCFWLFLVVFLLFCKVTRLVSGFEFKVCVALRFVSTMFRIGVSCYQQGKVSKVFKLTDFILFL